VNVYRIGYIGLVCRLTEDAMKGTTPFALVLLFFPLSGFALSWSDGVTHSKADYARSYASTRVGQANASGFDGDTGGHDPTVRLRSNEAPAFGKRGLTPTDTRDEEEAHANYKQGIQFDPIEIDVFNHIARWLGIAPATRWASLNREAQSKNTEGAHPVSDGARLYFSRGVVRADAGDLDGALKDFDKAIRLSPTFVDAFKNRGVARAGQGDLDGALADFTEAIRLNPNDSALFNNRGLARAEKGDLAGALDDYFEAARLNPDNADVLINRGNALVKLGDLDGALADFDRAIQLKPEDALIYYNRGAARADQGDLDGAVEDYDQAIRLNPDDADVFSNRGIARAAMGDLEGALADFDRAIRRKPDAQTYYNRGVARANKGDLEGALTDFDEAIRLKPDLMEAHENREKLLLLRARSDDTSI
jgi:tetratricopeptide (TPR) repeat protein